MFKTMWDLGNAEDLTGQRFGELTAVSRVGSWRRYATWRCRCSCGVEVSVVSDRLKRGLKKYCARKNHRKHPGALVDANPLTYRSWMHMNARCRATQGKNWRNYGGRGIAVCERWRDSFENFFRDMGPRPSAQHSIGRRDNDKGYEPDNCRWETSREQTRNKRTTVYLLWRGERRTLVDVCEELGLSPEVARSRLRIGWTVDEALMTPAKRSRPRHVIVEERKALITARHSRKKAREARKAANVALRAKLVMSTKPSAGIPKRSVIVAGHRTSISVEGPFWAAVMGAAAARQLSINDLITEIATEMAHNDDAANLSSAVRLWVLARANAAVEQIGPIGPVTVGSTAVGIVAGKLTYGLADGSTINCTCIAGPYAEQIVEGLRRRAAATTAVP